MKAKWSFLLLLILAPPAWGRIQKELVLYELHDALANQGTFSSELLTGTTTVKYFDSLYICGRYRVVRMPMDGLIQIQIRNSDEIEDLGYSALDLYFYADSEAVPRKRDRRLRSLTGESVLGQMAVSIQQQPSDALTEFGYGLRVLKALPTHPGEDPWHIWKYSTLKLLLCVATIAHRNGTWSLQGLRKLKGYVGISQPYARFNRAILGNIPLEDMYADFGGKEIDETRKYKELDWMDSILTIEISPYSGIPLNEWVNFMILKARALSERGKPDEAVSLLHEALKITPKNPDLIFGIGELHRKSGDKRSALEKFRQAITLGSKEGLAHYWIAFWLSKDKRKLKKAIAEYRKALPLFRPDQAGDKARTFYDIGKIYDELGNHRKSSRYYRQALKIDPDRFRFLFALGTALSNAGRTRKAVEAIARAIEVNPYIAQSYWNLAVLLEKTGDKRKALRSWEQFAKISSNPKHADTAKKRISALQADLLPKKVRRDNILSEGNWARLKLVKSGPGDESRALAYDCTWAVSGKTPEGGPILEFIIEASPRDTRELVKRGQAAFLKKSGLSPFSLVHRKIFGKRERFDGLVAFRSVYGQGFESALGRISTPDNVSLYVGRSTQSHNFPNWWQAVGFAEPELKTQKLLSLDASDLRRESRYILRDWIAKIPQGSTPTFSPSLSRISPELATIGLPLLLIRTSPAARGTWPPPQSSEDQRSPRGGPPSGWGASPRDGARGPRSTEGAKGGADPHQKEPRFNFKLEVFGVETIDSIMGKVETLHLRTVLDREIITGRNIRRPIPGTETIKKESRVDRYILERWISPWVPGPGIIKEIRRHQVTRKAYGKRVKITEDFDTVEYFEYALAEMGSGYRSAFPAPP